MLKAKPLTPLLKWAGGKKWLAPKLNELYDPHRHRRLIEPFCGGLGVTLGLQPDQALLNDINEHLINFYQIVKDGGFEFDRENQNTERDYYTIRNGLNCGRKDGYLSAQYFYYLNLAGFNGLCRYNSKGDFNVPYGHRKKLAVCEDFRPYQNAMRYWSFQCDGYQDLDIENDDFIIVDPPYDAGFTSYSGNAFGWQQQIELVDWLDKLPKIPQVACNLATDRIIKLYADRGWNIELVEAPRSISCDGNRKKVTEMLATRYL